MIEKANSDKIAAGLRAPYELPCERADAHTNLPSTLIGSDESWDEINLEHLLRLKDIYKQNSTVEFKLRPYWMPATKLFYHSSSLIKHPSEVPFRTESKIERSMLKCEAFCYMWLENVTASLHIRDTWAPMGETIGTICCYNQNNHTLRSKVAGSSEDLSPKGNNEAKKAAISGLPFLFPLQPLRIGDSWRGEVDKIHMTYNLIKEENISGMCVLIIKREGYIEHSQEPHVVDAPVIRAVGIQISGLTAFAFNRGVVLEDRMKQHFVSGGGDLSKEIEGIEIKLITRLMRSMPNNNHKSERKYDFERG